MYDVKKNVEVLSMKRVSIVVLAFLVAFTWGCKSSANTPQSSTTTNPATAQGSMNKAKIEKVAEDFVIKMARGNPQAQIKVLKISKSVIPGVAKVRVEWKQGGYGKRFNLYVTNDGKYIFMGPIVAANANLNSITTEEEDFVDEKMINTKGAPSIGPDNAPVRIVEFADFECPYCGKMYGEMKQILEKYKGKVKFTFKQFPLPFHPWAKKAAIIAQCAFEQNPNAFWDFYNFFYGNQRDITLKNIDTKSFEEAKKAGLNLAKFKKCLKNPLTEKAIEESMQDGKKVQVRATPTIFINGRYIPGAIPISQLEKIIQEELNKAK